MANPAPGPETTRRAAFRCSATITTMQALGAAFGASLAGIIANPAGLASPGGGGR